MARNLKKFVNPKFVRTCDLKLMRRLISRHKEKLSGFDPATLDGDEEEEAREALRKFFEGPDNGYPPGLKADLHRIEELGNRNGMRLLIERAKAMEVALISKKAAGKKGTPDAKALALTCFLDHRAVFDAASDLMAIETKPTLSEFRGIAADTPAALDEETKKSFELAARKFLTAELQGGYCRVGWYKDDDEINIVVVHGMEFTTELVIESDQEKVISFQPAGTAVLTYDQVDGRLKVGGVPKAQREPFSELFAATMLSKPGFFAAEDAQDLYTLAPVEERGSEFAFNHEFDAGIRSVKVIEAQADRVGPAAKGKTPRRQWCVLVKDPNNALRRMREATKVTFPAYQLTHIALNVEFDSESGRKPSVGVKVVPPRAAHFKRHAFESRVLELLRRNGVSVERKADTAAIAAE